MQNGSPVETSSDANPETPLVRFRKTVRKFCIDRMINKSQLGRDDQNHGVCVCSADATPVKNRRASLLSHRRQPSETGESILSSKVEHHDPNTNQHNRFQMDNSCISHISLQVQFSLNHFPSHFTKREEVTLSRCTFNTNDTLKIK